LAIVRIECTGGGDGISVRAITLTAERGSLSLALYLWGIAPLGVGLTGRGVEHPPPLSPACQRERFSWMVTPPLFHHVTGNLSPSTTPAPRRVPRLLPPPPGGGQ